MLNTGLYNETACEFQDNVHEHLCSICIPYVYRTMHFVITEK